MLISITHILWRMQVIFKCFNGVITIVIILHGILDFILGEDTISLEVSASLAEQQLDEWLITDLVRCASDTLCPGYVRLTTWRYPLVNFQYGSLGINPKQAKFDSAEVSKQMKYPSEQECPLY